jgi:hypothetical protein
MPSPRTTYILALLVLITTGYVFFFEPKLQTTEQLMRSAGRIFDVHPAQVARLKIYRDQWTSVLLERENDSSFRIVEPSSGAADSAEVAKLLSALEFASSSATLDGDGGDEARLYEYGLSPPVLQVSVALSSGNETGFMLGKETPTQDGVYLKVLADPHVYVVEKPFFELFEKYLNTVTGQPALAPQNETAVPPQHEGSMIPMMPDAPAQYNVP